MGLGSTEFAEFRMFIIDDGLLIISQFRGRIEDSSLYKSFFFTRSGSLIKMTTAIKRVKVAFYEILRVY